jgi:lauroyl/myristoyl acyltransferase
MASRNPVLRALGSASSRLWFPAVLATARAFPRSALHRCGSALARAYYRTRPKYLRAARANLSVILGRPADAPEVRRLAVEMVASHFAAWVDFLQFATRPPEQSALLVESVTGYSRIVEGRLSGKGVLLLTAHLGNWEVGGLMLAQVNQPICVVLVPDIFPGVERERRRLHERLGVREIRVDRGPAPTLAVLRALSENGIVAMQGDRDFDNTGVALPFFGREAFFPRGPLRVAMASGATVLPAFIVRVPDGRYRAIVEEPLPIETAGDRDAALSENLRRYAAILERYVAQYPEQWYCFYPFWDDPSRRRET